MRHCSDRGADGGGHGVFPGGTGDRHRQPEIHRGGDHRRLRELLIQKITEITPQGNRSLLIGVILHKRTRHIHTEPVTARFQPESHNILDALPGSQRILRIHGLLPAWILNLIAPVV